ncbi:MAG TPA: 16S rRNA (cytosine(1402)-N(4))-methyltransferase RsmH [Vicinamibacterales bacterium]
MPGHVPVMRAEVLTALAPARGGLFVDCTIGLGGHADALLEAGATRVVGIDRDADALAVASDRLARWGERVVLVHADYRELNRVLDARTIDRVDGVLVDLGVSSLQFDGEGRGFSFQRDEPLDMRMDRSSGITAADLIAGLPEKELADLVYQFGEERYSRRIARAIVEARQEAPVATTGQLAAIVRRAVPRRGYSPIHPATRTFQALRIRVNEELEGLDAFIGHACQRLAPNGRLAMIAFHSLEDRIVKHTLRRLVTQEQGSFRILTKKPLPPTDEEVVANPRARSARLRALERIA